MASEFDLQGIASNFQLGGPFISAERFGSGHINDTFLISVESNPATSRFILQRVNKYVFDDPAALMGNISRVTDHLRKKNAKCLALVPTVDGQDFYNCSEDEFWRAYEFVQGGVTYDEALDTQLARDAAAKFGEFQGLLADLPAPRLHETIPDFHNTRARYARFHEVVKDDSYGRAKLCANEIDQALAWEEEAGTLVALHEAGQIPERITHNDTKLNNLLFDEASGNPVCVIDLDTVMPGLALYDFGDMVRTTTSPTSEDTTDLASVGLRLPYFEALVEGYVEATRDFLSKPEIEHLSISGKIITIETGLRFLTDYLSGDQYFGSKRPAQNLDRARTQFALAKSIEEQFDEMQDIVRVSSSMFRAMR